jgi:hypothetical protein
MKPGYLKIAAIVCGVLLLAGTLWSATPQRSLTVQVREGQLRSTPSFLGKIIATPLYGERVLLLEDQGAWQKVARGGVQGWMHASALTARTLVLKAGQAAVPTSATGGEIALAGKGFNEEVEKQYRSLHRELDYTWLDRMARFRVPPEQMQAFLQQGGVTPAAGARP